MTDARRALPSVTALLESRAVRPLLDRAPRTVVVEAIRDAIAEARQAPHSAPTSEDDWARVVSSRVDSTTRPSLRRVINATGVVLHTNLGRAPLARVAIEAIERVARGFSNLEYDVATGTRGSRYTHCAALLRELTGAEDGLVVNNCAAALVLVLNTVADRHDAILSRGELVEIGGSFRVPDIMQKSGARLVEVGTTNRTHLDDYRKAIVAHTGALLKVHRSNFALSGFVADVDARSLAALAAEHGLPLLHDLGSGLMVPLDAYGLSGEPTARDALAAGASVVMMSGDKMLGGPQAGLILGKREILDRVRRNPLTRSYRVDKLTLAALEATLALYREPDRALREIPALAQLTASAHDLRTRATRLRDEVNSPRISVVDTEASVGGGAFPDARIPSIGLAIVGNANEIERALRAGDPATIARVQDDRVLLDLRTIFPGDEADIVAALGAVAELPSHRATEPPS